MTLLREVESLASQQEPPTTQRLGLQEEMQRYESELIRDALQRTRARSRAPVSSALTPALHRARPSGSCADRLGPRIREVTPLRDDDPMRQ